MLSDDLIVMFINTHYVHNELVMKYSEDIFPPENWVAAKHCIGRVPS